VRRVPLTLEGDFSLGIKDQNAPAVATTLPADLDAHSDFATDLRLEDMQFVAEVQPRGDSTERLDSSHTRAGEAIQRILRRTCKEPIVKPMMSLHFTCNL